MSDTTGEEYERILEAAALAGPRVAASTRAERAVWLAAAGDALDAAADELVPLAMAETHLAEARLRGELARTTFQLRLFGEVLLDGGYLGATIDHADPDWGMGPRPDLRRTRVPLGPVAVYAASNFPFAFSVAGGDTASALAAGCPVVVKAHPGHPGLSRRVAAIVAGALRDAGAPDGTFGLVAGMDVGTRLVQDPRITAAGFTGSLGGGRALFDLAAARPVPIPFYGELGSVNPVVVTSAAAGARAAAIAKGFVGSMSLGVGQFCTKPGLLFVPAGSGIAEAAAAAAGEAASAAMLMDRIRSGFDAGLRALAEHPDVRVLAGGPTDAETPAITVLATTASAFLADPETLATECFGPTALVVEYDGADQALEAVRALDGQLTGTVHGEDDDPEAPALVAEFARRVGRVLWNGWPTGVTVSWAQQHGGPYPATTASGSTSVGTAAIDRWLRPVAFQDLPQHLLPEELRDPDEGLPRRIDGRLQP